MHKIVGLVGRVRQTESRENLHAFKILCLWIKEEKLPSKILSPTNITWGFLSWKVGNRLFGTLHRFGSADCCCKRDYNTKPVFDIR